MMRTSAPPSSGPISWWKISMPLTRALGMTISLPQRKADAPSSALSGLETRQPAREGPDARRRPTAAREAYSAWRAEPKARRSEEHTSELQSQSNLARRLLLEKKNKR